MSLADGKNLHSAVDYKKLKAIERIKSILDGIEKDYLKVIDVQYFQTLDYKNSISIITKFQDPRYKYNKKE